MKRARRLLALEAAERPRGDAKPADGAATTPAKRAYDKLRAQMAPLVGDAGFDALFVRSAKLARGDFASLAGVSLLDGTARLLELLETEDPTVSERSTEILFGTFLSLVGTFIGERLTMQVVRRAFPTLDAVDDAADDAVDDAVDDTETDQ